MSETYESPRTVTDAGRRLMTYIMDASGRGATPQTILLGVIAEAAVWSQTPADSPAHPTYREGVA